MTQGGHLVFQTAANHNITFQSNSGGYINLDGENFKTIVQIVSTRRNSVMIETHAYTHARTKTLPQRIRTNNLSFSCVDQFNGNGHW